MMNGFLHAEGRKIIDGNGDEIVLKGWGLGNWLLPEGYMWESGCPRFDRPRRIEQVIEELTGKEYSKRFWQEFRNNYIRKEDIQYMAKLGYNSVRIPINWRVLMEDAEEIIWKEEGFQLIDRCIEWCKDEKMYVFLDLHGAPGGQTGSNIDDSIDDVPRLFTDKDSWNKGVLLWEKLALRYVDEKWVGGYDLLNEPIAVKGPDEPNFDHLEPKLREFYREVIQRIRKIDKNHMLSLEGIHWATNVSIFDEYYDDNIVLHFHRYAEKPEYKCLKLFIEKAEELNVPLWLGETGENCNEWYTALYPLAVSFNIGYNLWPWKKMNCTNSPCSILRPEGYEKVLDYTLGGPHPGFEESRKIFDQYLKNILLENCILNEDVTRHVHRKAPFSMYAVDFDEVGGKGNSFWGCYQGENTVGYREETGLEIRELYPPKEKKFVFDCQWERFGLVLKENEFVTYTIAESKNLKLTLELCKGESAHLVVKANEISNSIDVKENQETVEINWEDSCVSFIKLSVDMGSVCIKRLIFE